MTTEPKILTDEQIDAAQEAAYRALVDKGYNGGMDGYQWDRASARAIEQAVLQSPLVQQWKKDADAFRAMVSKRLTVSVRELGHEVEVFHWDDCLAHPPCDPDADDDTRAEVTRSAITEAIAAMEAKDE